MRNNWENISASLTTDGRRRLHIQRECYKSHTDDFNNDNAICTGRDRGVSGLLVSGVGSGDQDPIHIAERKHVQREGTREGNKHKARAWIVDGDQLIRCSTAHTRPLTYAEQTLCLLRDGETTSFQETVLNLLPQPEDFVELVETDHMPQADEISAQDQAEEQNVPR